MSENKKVTKLPEGRGTLTEFDDGRQHIETEFGKFEIDADGSVKATHEIGVTEIDENGNSRIKLNKPITKITIDNLTQLKTHTIEESESAISHHLVFRGGGEYRLTYRKNGDLIEARGHNITCTMNNDGQIILCDKEED